MKFNAFLSFSISTFFLDFYFYFFMWNVACIRWIASVWKNSLIYSHLHWVVSVHCFLFYGWIKSKKAYWCLNNFLLYSILHAYKSQVDNKIHNFQCICALMCVPNHIKFFLFYRAAVYSAKKNEQHIRRTHKTKKNSLNISLFKACCCCCFCRV